MYVNSTWKCSNSQKSLGISCSLKQWNWPQKREGNWWWRWHYACLLKLTRNIIIMPGWKDLKMLEMLYGDADFISPAHTAKGTKSWFNGHGVTVLDWPANSPDLNPIENLWGIVKRKMRDTRPNNADELKATVKETWASIPPQQCHKLITSMPRRIEAVIKAKGAPTQVLSTF